MEASKFRFGRDMPPAFKFDPTDADIVAHYLLPRALNLHNPYAEAIIEEDPGSAPPWEMLRRHGDVDHAFFFGPPTDLSHNGGRKNRNVGGGVWQGQKAVEGTVTLLRPGGGEADIKYKRYDLSFCRTKRGRTTGYVMHEYEILSPPLPGTVLTRIKAPRSDKRQQVVPDPEQAGPSHEYDAAAMIGYDEGCGVVQDGVLYSGGMVKKAKYDNNNNYCALMHDQPGARYNYDAAAMNGVGFNFNGEQAPAFYGGGMVDTSGADYDPSGYVPECGGDYSYGEYQQWQYQQDMSNQYQAGDDAVMCTGGEGFSGEYQQWQYQQDPSNQYQAGDDAVMLAGGKGFSQGGEEQAGALCGNSDNGSVMIPETSAHSTISLSGEYQQWQYQQDPSNQYQAGDDAVMLAGGKGFSQGGEEQAGALCGNSDNGSVMIPETSAHSTISLSGEYQQWQYQQDPSNQYQAGDDAVMHAGGEGFSQGGEEQAGALCGNSDNGSVVGTETSAHSTISLCGDGEVECDDASFYNLFFGDDDDLKCEQNGAGDPAN